MFAEPLKHFVLDRLESPIGMALLAVDEEGYLRALDWEDYGDRHARLLTRFSGGLPTTQPGTAPASIRDNAEALEARGGAGSTQARLFALD